MADDPKDSGASNRSTPTKKRASRPRSRAATKNSPKNSKVTSKTDEATPAPSAKAETASTRVVSMPADGVDAAAPTDTMPEQPEAEVGSAVETIRATPDQAPAQGTETPDNQRSTGSIGASDSPPPAIDATGLMMTTAQSSNETSGETGTHPTGTAAPRSAAITQNTVGILLAGLIGLAAGALAISYPVWTPHIYSNGVAGATSTDVTAGQVNRRMNGEIQKLQGKIDELTRGSIEMQKAIIMARLPGILMVAGSLNEVLQQSAPFEKELRLFDAVTGGASDEAKAIIEALTPYAASGAPTEDQLVASVDELVFQIISTDQKITSIPQLPDQMSSTMASISAITMRLRWRLEGLPIGDSVPATMARVEENAKERNFTGAVAELETLPEVHRASAEAWINGLRARQALDAVREDLESYLLAGAVRVPQ